MKQFKSYELIIIENALERLLDKIDVDSPEFRQTKDILDKVNYSRTSRPDIRLTKNKTKVSTESNDR